jgi:hypothetical protein
MYNSWLALWIPITSSLGGNEEINAIAQYKGQYVMGGDFSAVDGNAIGNLAYQDTSDGVWKELANVSGGTVQDILVIGDSLIYIGGTFSQVNGQNIAGVAVYDGTGWSELGQNFAFYDNVYALGWDAPNQELIVGGAFDRVQQSNGDDLMTQGLAFWDGDQWSTRGSVEARFTSPAQYAAIVYSIDSRPNGEIFIGGEFSGIAGINTDRIAQWLPGSGWQALMDGGISKNACYLSQNPAVKTVAAVEPLNKLYLGGTFNQSGLESAGKFASYGLGRGAKTTIIDSMLSVCNVHLFLADTTYENLKWSTGDTTARLLLGPNFMEDRPQRLLKVWGEKHGCFYRDSIFLEVGVNMNVYAYDDFRWEFDTTNRSIAFWFVKDLSYHDTLSFDFGDGTVLGYTGMANIPDTVYHTYSNPGIYEVKFHYGNYCGWSNRDTTFNFSTTAIGRQYAVDFRLYPNPNEGSFQLQYQSASGGGKVKLELFDMMGRSLWKNEVQVQALAVSKEFQIDGLKPGRYVLRMLDGEKSGRKILVVK